MTPTATKTAITATTTAAPIQTAFACSVELLSADGAEFEGVGCCVAVDEGDGVVVGVRVGEGVDENMAVGVGVGEGVLPVGNGVVTGTVLI